MIHGFQSLQIHTVYSFKGCVSLNFVHYTEKEFADFSGYEVSTNRFHIEDFTDQDPFIQSIIFANQFKKKWLINFPLQSVNMIIAFQDDEIGRFATFTFHKIRNGEVVHDVNNLELYDQPIYVEVLYAKSGKS